MKVPYWLAVWWGPIHLLVGALMYHLGRESVRRHQCDPPGSARFGDTFRCSCGKDYVFGPGIYGGGEWKFVGMATTSQGVVHRGDGG